MTSATVAHPPSTLGKQATGRGWRVLPPILREYDGPGPEGLSIVGEIDGEAGVVLWKILRAVALWAETDNPGRAELFADDTIARLSAELRKHVPDDEGLRNDLEDLLSVVKSPTGAEPAFVSRASGRVAEWASERGATFTQIEFLRLAALASPAEPRYAVELGGIARDVARYSSAEAWLHRAIGLARGANDWHHYVMAYLKHGVMMTRRGALPAARRSFIKALRRSRRQGLRDGETRALHELMILEWRSGQRERAFQYAAEAVAAHGPAHPRLLQLVHDVAYLWLEAGHCGHALPVFLATYERVGAPERPAVLGSVARAAAGIADVHTYRWAWDRLERHADAPGVAEAWVDLARAAFQLERHAESEEAARCAEAIARLRGEGQMRFLAESIMADLEASRVASYEHVDKDAPASVSPADDPDRLAREILRTLASDRAQIATNPR